MEDNYNFINEQCSICGKEFRKVSQIRVDMDSDRYVCKKCARIHNLHTTECGDYSDEEI